MSTASTTFQFQFRTLHNDGTTSPLMGSPRLIGSPTLSTRSSPHQNARNLKPKQEEVLEEVAAWQTEVDSLEQKQLKIQENQMTTLFSQIHILTRELGALQKQFMAFGANAKEKVEELRADLTSAQEEAHSALRLELAEHGKNAAEMRAAWEDARKAILGNFNHFKEEHAMVLADHVDNHSSTLRDMEDLHNQRYEEHQAALQTGLFDLHGSLQRELADLRSAHKVGMTEVVTDLTGQLDILTMEMEQLRQDIVATQEEAYASVRLELAQHGRNAAEMKADWDENLSSLAEQHAQALVTHKAEQTQALAAHTKSHAGSLFVQSQRYEDHQAAMKAGLENVHGYLAELRSRHDVSLKGMVTDLISQVDNLTTEMEQLREDIVAAQEEAHAALRLELAEHGNNAAEMKASWEEAHKALTDSMDENLSDLAKQHAQALDAQKAEHAQALAGYADTMGMHGNTLTELEALHTQRYLEHQSILQAGLEGVHGNLQKELADLRSGHAVNLKAIVTDLTGQVENLTANVEQMAQDIVNAQEEAHAALRLELAEHGSNAAEMKAAWQEAHKALTDSMDEQLGNLAKHHSQLTDDYSKSHAARINEMEDNVKQLFDKHDGLNDLHNQKHAENAAALEKGLDRVLDSAHGRLQEELAVLRSGHATNLKDIVEDVTQQVETLTLVVENSCVLRKANTKKVDQVFKGMSKAMNVSFKKSSTVP